MERRSFVGTVATGLAALAGCSAADVPGRPDAGPESTSTPEASNPERTPAYASPEGSTDLVGEFDPARTDASRTVGDRNAGSGSDRSHALEIWNAASEPRTLEVRVTDRREESTAVDEAFEVSADGSVSISFVEPSSYLVDVGVAAIGTGASLTVGSGAIDCNASSTYVRVGPDGTFTSSSFSTMVECPSDQEA